MNLVEQITAKGVALEVRRKRGWSFTGDKSDAMSQLILSMLGAVYQFERTIMLERQREGIEIAKAGKFTGRKATIDNQKILETLKAGNSISKTAEICGVSKSSVQRAKKAA